MRAPILSLLALGLAFAAPAAAAVAAPDCNRACLTGLADRYADAMVRKDPKSLPFAEVVKFSEDHVPMMIGDALWASISARSPSPLRLADVSAGQVVWMGYVEEHGEPSYLALRLKVEEGRIAEVESVVRRRGGPAPYGDPKAYAAHPSFAEILPKAQRRPRDQLIALADGYLDSVQKNDGRVLTSFSPDCVRIDNGVNTTQGDEGPAALVDGCEAQLELGVFAATDRVRARAFPVVDEERGVVVATGVMDHSVKSRTFRTTDGREHQTQTVYPVSYAFVQAFRIRDGRIERIETIYSPVPYLMPSPYVK